MGEEKKEKAVSRRKYLGAVGGLAAAAAVGWGVAGYALSKPPAPAVVKTETKTLTETKTITGEAKPTVPRFPGTEITVITWGSWLIESLIKEGVKQPLLREFENETGITVKFEIVAEDVAREKLMMDLTAHTGAYDIVSADMYDIPVYAEAGYILPIDPLIKEYANPKYFSFGDYFLPSIASNTWKGKLYSLPIYEHACAVTYRKDLFEKYGLKPPNNMEELTEAAKTLHNPPDIYGITMRGKKGEEPPIIAGGFTWAYGGHWFEGNARTPDEIKKNKALPTFNESHFVAGVEKYVELLRKYGPPASAMYSWYEVCRDICAGKAAIAVDGDFVYWWGLLNAEFENPKEKLGIALAPIGPSGHRVQAWWDFSHCINADSKHPEAAFQVVQLLSSVQLAWELAKNGVAGIARMSVMQSDEFAEVFGKEAQRIYVAARALAEPEFMPVFPEYHQVRDAFGTAVSEAIAGEKTVKQALDDAQKKAYDIMKRGGYYD